MKWILSAISLLLFCGCTHIETPHHVGDKLELIRDVYVVEHAGKSLPDITVNIETKSKWVWPNFPIEVSETNIGETHLEKKIVGVLRAGTVLEIKRVDLVDGGAHVYKYLFLNNIQTGAVYDLTDNRLIDTSDITDGLMYSLTPLVFKPIPKLGDGKER